MPELHREEIDNLERCLSDILSELTVGQGNMLTVDCFSKLRSLEGKLNKNRREELERYIGNNPLSRFFTARICHLLSRIAPHVQLSEVIKLKDVPNLPEDLPKLLIGELESLPWSYTVLIELPLLRRGCGLLRSFEISKYVTLFIPDADSLDYFGSEDSTLGALAGCVVNGNHQVPRLDPNSYYLKVDLLGFISPLETSTLEEFIGHLKAFWALGLAVGLFEEVRRSPYNFSHSGFRGDGESNARGAFHDLFAFVHSKARMEFALTGL